MAPPRAVPLLLLLPGLAAAASASAECATKASGGQGMDEQGACSGAGDEMQLLSKQVRLHAHGGGGPLTERNWDGFVPGALRLEAGPGLLQQRAGYEACYLANSSCALARMKGKPTLVYPGGRTTCIDGSDYAFAVVPRDANKLLFLFGPGGACWEANGAYGKQVVFKCATNVDYAIQLAGPGVGVQDYENKNNPFRDYTLVEVLYCSGDAHFGDTVLVNGNATYRQAGLHNSKAALKWAARNFENARLSSLVVMGVSAGSLGAAAWGDKVLQTFRGYERATVILDSYAGVFPGSTQSATIQTWTAGCKLPILAAPLLALCREGTLTVQIALERTMQKYSEVAFASIQSKVDETQITFYRGMAQSWGMANDMRIAPAQFYVDANNVYERYSAHPNYVVYMVTGEQHCFTTLSLFYTASAAGPDADPVAEPMLDKWVGKLIRSRRHTASQCDGLLLPNEASNGETYCDKRLLPKPLILSG